jgi:choline dehydrogenase-like flavoprotein
MIFSLDEYGSTQSLQATICIVGAGAAGISLACEFDGSGHDVMLIEAGGLRIDEAATNAMYRGTANDPHTNPSEFREVVFGGTTAVWGGRCVPFDPIDFERRDYVPGSGWPISYEDVAQYYPRAMSYFDAGKFDFSLNGSVPEAIPTIPGLSDFSVVLGDCIERYSLPTDFGRKYRKKIARSLNVTALLNARCVRIDRSPGNDRVESIVVVDRGHARRIVKAEVFVLALGGIEIPRLMMSSDPDGPGLGNHSDQLGRYYTCHFENFAGRVVTTRGQILPYDFEKTNDGVYSRRKLQFSARAQRDHRLLNTAFRLHFPAYSDAGHQSPIGSAIFLAKSTLPPEYRAIMQHGAIVQHGGEPAVISPVSAHLRNVVLGMPELGRFGFRWIYRRLLARRKLPYALFRNPDGSYPIEFDSEQTPLASSRITLTRDVDHDGLRRVQIDWHVNPDDIAAAHRAFHLLRHVMNEKSLCRFEFDEQSLAQAISESIPGGGHHIGTTRMASTPRDGVVDRNCAVFGLPNLYVASSSVFATSGHANPTLNIVALALRLADHLKAKLRPAACHGIGARETLMRDQTQ